MKAPTPAEWHTMRDRAVERIAAAETELAAAHELLERCDTALECSPTTPRPLLRGTLRQASAELAAAPAWVREGARGVSGVEFAPPRELTLAEVNAGAERAAARVDAWPEWKRAVGEGTPDSILETARRAGASDPILMCEADGLRLFIGPVDDPVAIGRALHERGSVYRFLGSRQVLITSGVSFRFERRPGVQLPLPPLPPLSTVGPAGNRGAV